MTVYVLQIVDHTFCIAEAMVYNSYEAAKNVASQRISELKDSDSVLEVEEGSDWFNAKIDTTKVSIKSSQI